MSKESNVGNGQNKIKTLLTSPNIKKGFINNYAWETREDGKKETLFLEWENSELKREMRKLSSQEDVLANVNGEYSIYLIENDELKIMQKTHWEKIIEKSGGKVVDEYSFDIEEEHLKLIAKQIFENKELNRNNVDEKFKKIIEEEISNIITRTFINDINEINEELTKIRNKISEAKNEISSMQNYIEFISNKDLIKKVELIIPGFNKSTNLLMSNNSNQKIDVDYIEKKLNKSTRPLSEEKTIELVEQKIDADKFTKELAKKKLYYENELVEGIINSIEANRLTILKGNPGFGKTTLIVELSKAYNNNLDKKYAEYTYTFISVKPDWIDTSSILGHINVITGEPEITDFTKIIFLANKFKDLKFFVCFDEFNLARPENYFAPFLSKLEMKDNEREIEIFPNYKIPIGNNLKFLCTINEDQSTFELSPKVINRSDIINCEPSKEYYTQIVEKIVDDANNEIKKIVLDFINLWYSEKNTPPISYRILSNLDWLNMNDKSLDLIFSNRILPNISLLSINGENEGLKEELLKYFEKNGYSYSKKFINSINTSILEI